MKYKRGWDPFERRTQPSLFDNPCLCSCANRNPVPRAFYHSTYCPVYIEYRQRWEALFPPENMKDKETGEGVTPSSIFQEYPPHPLKKS
jgi:hypothetical protein